MGNAIKFTPSGDVTVTVAVQSAQPRSVVLHFRVFDTGIGIPPEKQRMIFEPFSQADGSTTRRFGGTGLGLSISHQLVLLMGGALWLDSAIGVGSTFHFTACFDLAADDEMMPGRASSRAGLPGVRRRRRVAGVGC